MIKRHRCRTFFARPRCCPAQRHELCRRFRWLDDKKISMGKCIEVWL